MAHRATQSPSFPRPRTLLLAGLAVLGPLIVGLAVERSGAGSTPATVPPTPASEPQAASMAASPSASASVPAITASRPSTTPTGRDEADGAIPDGASVSVFDDELPAVGRLDPDLLDALRRAATDAGAGGVDLRVTGGWRSPGHQQELWQEAVVEYGSPQAAARWVAPPETSAHVAGDAVDVGPPAAAAWLSRRGARYGLCRVYGNEPWHFELRPGAADHGCPPMYADAAQDPRLRR